MLLSALRERSTRRLEACRSRCACYPIPSPLWLALPPHRNFPHTVGFESPEPPKFCNHPQHHNHACCSACSIMWLLPTRTVSVPLLVVLTPPPTACHPFLPYPTFGPSKQVCHTDANESNVLVNEDRTQASGRRARPEAPLVRDTPR